MSGSLCRKILGLLLMVGLGVSRVAAVDWDDRFVGELRRIRLWNQARDVCEQRFSGSEKARDAAHWSVEGMRTDAAAALEAIRDNERAQRWKAVEGWAQRFRQRFPGSPWDLQVALQSVLARLARGEAERLAAELADGDRQTAQRQKALETLRRAERRLRELTQRMERGAGGSSSDPVPPDVLQGIENQLVLAAAKVYWNRALCYPKQSDDRLAALEAARSNLRRLIRQTRPENLVQIEALLWLARCQRELGEAGEAEKTLRLLAKRKDVPAKWKLELDAELLRLAHERHQRKLPVEPRIGRTVHGVHSIEWDFVSLRVLLDRLALSRDREAESLQQEIDRGLTTIELVHGPYWGRRATRLMVGHSAGVASIASARLLERSAREKLGQRKWQEAVELLREAAEAASRSGEPEEAFRLAYQSALVEQQHGVWEGSAEALRGLSLRWRKDSRAPQAHLMAIWSLARADGGELADNPTYLTWLDEQIHLWPKAEATSRARVWLAMWLRSKNKLDEAARTLAGVNWSGSAAADAGRELFLVWLTRIQRAADGSAMKELADEVDRYFDPLFGDRAGTGDGSDACLLPLIRWQLQLATRGRLPDDALALLQTASNGNDASAACRTRAQFVLAVLGEIGADVLKPALWKTVTFDQIQWLALVWQRQFRGESADRSRRAASVAAVLKAWLAVRGEQVTLSQRIFALQVRADALAHSGKREEAATILRKLVEQHPRRIDVRRAWARFLMAGERRAEWALAEQQWRRLASRLKPGTADWYEAKYGVANSLWLQGKKSECRERLEYLKATRGFGPPAWSQRLAKLARQCGAED